MFLYVLTFRTKDPHSQGISIQASTLGLSSKSGRSKVPKLKWAPTPLQSALRPFYISLRTTRSRHGQKIPCISYVYYKAKAISAKLRMSGESYKKDLRKSWESPEKVLRGHKNVLRKSWESPEKVLRMSWESHENGQGESCNGPQKVPKKSWKSIGKFLRKL